MAGLDSIYFEQIQFVDNKQGWICGEYGKIYHTNDGGETWQEMDQMDLPTMVLNLEKSPGGEIWGSGGNTIFMMENGRCNIKFHDTTRSTGQIRDLLFIGQDTILGVSIGGRAIFWLLLFRPELCSGLQIFDPSGVTVLHLES